MTDPEELLQRVQWRVDRYTRGGEAAAVISPDAWHELVALVQLSFTDNGTRTAYGGVQAAAWLAWCRFRASGNPRERGVAADLFGQLARVRPDLVPAEAWTELTDGPDQVLVQAQQMLSQSLHARDMGGVHQALATLRDLEARATEESKPVVRASLGGGLLDLYGFTGDRAVLDQAITVLEAASQTPNTFAALGKALLERGDERGIWHLRQVLDLVHPSEVMAQVAAVDLVEVLNSIDADPTMLDHAIEALRLGPEKPELLTVLNKALYLRFRAADDVADLIESLEVMRRRVDLLEPGSTDWVAGMIDLTTAANIHLVRTRTGATELLAAYVEFAAGAPNDEFRGLALLGQARTHRLRYQFEMDHADLTHAVARVRDALPLLNEDQKKEAWQLLADALVDRAYIRGSAVDALEAARALQEVPEALVPYGIALNAVAEFSRDQVHFVEAERVLRDGLAQDLSDAERSIALNALGITYSLQRRHDESVDVLRQAYALDAGNPDIAANLAAALGGRSDDDYDEVVEVLTRAIESASPVTRAAMTMQLADAHRRHRSPECLPLYRTGAHDPALPSWGRVYAAHMWGWLAITHDDVAEALTAYTTAIDLLGLVAWRGLSRADQQRELARLNGLVPEAATAALVADQPRLAVEMLERGRSVLWAHQLDSGPVTPEPVAGLPPELALTQARMEIADGLAPVRRDVPSVSAPTVVVNIGHRRCDAVLLPSFEVVPLPCTFDEVNAQAQALQQIRVGGGPAHYAAAQDVVVEVLEFLWHRIVHPVLGKIKMPGDRLWWCPTGPATLLPLHAAGDYRRTGESLLDRVVSSYTPTLSLLARNGNGGGEGMLVVGASDLPGVAEEVAAVAARFPGCTTLVGEEATVERVREEITRHARLHIACHGKQNLRDPSLSHLELHDGPLTVASLLDLRVEADFAFLSACEASTSTHLPDESIHMAAALRFAGFRDVIATLWTMEDAAGPAVADAVYSSYSAGESPARALHDAVNGLRAERPYEPTAWAPFVHLG